MLPVAWRIADMDSLQALMLLWRFIAGGAGMAVPAFIGSSMCFGIDAFYPEWMSDQNKLNSENKAINPQWQL